jgi:hypothetical protein
MRVFRLTGMILVFILVFTWNAAAQNTQGVNYEGKAIVAVLPLAGEETQMIRRFYEGTVESVAALGKYTPRQVAVSTVRSAEIEIPTDMPPVPGLTAGARYALTGGVYPGSTAGEYYLQLWLWDMSSSTMIYTDDLVYDDIEQAMESLPGLVEWLFSHIREVTIASPPADTWLDPLFMLGVRAGLAQRWYTHPGELSSGASALNLEGGVSGALRLSPLFSFQLELLLTGDTLVYRGLNQNSGQYTMANKKYTNLSLMIPFLLKMNFRAGDVRLSPLGGLYAVAPLGKGRYSYSAGGSESYSWSYSVPLGFTLGLEGAVQTGTGRTFMGLRYGVDFGTATIRASQETRYERTMFSVYLGYEFGFFDGKKLHELLGDSL